MNYTHTTQSYINILTCIYKSTNITDNMIRTILWALFIHIIKSSIPPKPQAFYDIVFLA